ncbi:hypothetical protein PQ455_10435 [Sphingomonas naphthae]|uniref:RHS repeat protein n=1 Tax=Sphingomonas naphthae TaxID=1813468 RepID=A0ABY7TFY2_9SPHN|nr:hypothetical protein [Sphingomonas naphthae]WCT72065.1 hypothetical protein PQ455_10435 [Sphingomonas naphthae]
MALVGLPFASTFSFSRRAAAPVRDSSGAASYAPANVARFDYDQAGNPIGLLIEAGDRMGFEDRCTPIAGSWETSDGATIFHAWAGADGVVRYEARYTRSPRAAIAAALASVGHHRIIGAAPGYLFNLGGYVRYRGILWTLSPALSVGAGRALGDFAGRAIIA